MKGFRDPDQFGVRTSGYELATDLATGFRLCAGTSAELLALRVGSKVSPELLHGLAGACSTLLLTGSECAAAETCLILR
jgi:hypothetical protein